MKGVTLFIDESGTLPDPKDKVVVVAAVGTYAPEEIETIIKTVRKRGKFRKATGEIKFYTLGDKSRELFLRKIIEGGFNIFILVVEKIGRNIFDTPENFAVLAGLLLEDVLVFYPRVREIIFDRHFCKEKDTTEFNQILRAFLEWELPKISHVDSQKDKRVNIADMVAGAVLAKETGKKKYFYEILRKRVISEKRLNWPEAKRKLFKR